MNCYQALAGVYDALTTDVQYQKRADYLEKQFHKSQIPVRTVLDLACGTGTMACLLAERGYGVTAADGSEEMLAVAAQKAARLLEKPPFFLHQAMPRLRLLEPVDAAVSTLDSLNYLTRAEDVRTTFQKVFRYLKPGGVFLFDINSPFKLQRMDGQVWLDETEDVYCVWRTEYSRKTRICTYWVDLFERQPNGAWRRSGEEHRERAWDPEALRTWLYEAGFRRVNLFGDLRATAPGPEEDRLIFCCEKNLAD